MSEGLSREVSEANSGGTLEGIRGGFSTEIYAVV